jgi:hypothetical protein
MIENEMGNRGSKINAIALVKEQREDGSYCENIDNIINKSQLRCSLMTHESGRPTEILSKQKISLICCSKLNYLEPWLITGFVDREGFFTLELFKDSKAKYNYTPRLIFGINLHVKDLGILLNIKNTLQVGTVSTKGQVCRYSVKTFKDLAIIVNHFSNYPLVSSKKVSFEYWLQAYNIMKKKEHFNYTGFIKYVRLKSLNNNGLSEDLIKVFKNIDLSQIQILTYKFDKIPHGIWVAGFVSGDGSFYIKKTKYNNTYHIGCIFGITLNYKDVEILQGLFTYFNRFFRFKRFTSKTRKIPKQFNNGVRYFKDNVNLSISNFLDLRDIVIPFFDKYPITGVKKKDYEDFKKIHQLVRTKTHTTVQGLNEIIKIQDNINHKRRN